MILVHGFISSKLHVDSRNSSLYGLPSSPIDRLQAVQICAARLVTHSRKHDNIKPSLKQLHWLPVYSHIRHTHKILLLTFKVLHGLPPSYITEMLQPCKPSRGLRLSSKRLLIVPSEKLKKYGRRSFSLQHLQFGTHCQKPYVIIR